MDNGYRRKLQIAQACVSGGSLADFPVLVQVRDDRLGPAAGAGGRNLRFLDEHARLLAHEIVAFDERCGLLKAWVRVPELAAGRPTALFLVTDPGGPPSVDPVWTDDVLLAVQEPAADAVDRSPYRRRVEPCGGGGPAAWRIPWPSGRVEELTVEAWAETGEPRGEAIQALVSQWPIAAGRGAAKAVDAGRACGLDSTGFLGAVFDGRFIYFSPQHDGNGRHGTVLRYDSHQAFDAPGAWTARDAGRTDNLHTVGYYGAVFDGRFVYFVPRRDNEGYHTRVLRYDTHGSFEADAAWEAYDLGLEISYQGAAFDGRYVYLAPGYEHDEKSPSGLVIRYDTSRPFKSPESWSRHDAGTTAGLPTRCFDGAAWDGRRILFVPLDLGCALAYDTASRFDDPEGWRAIDLRPRGVQRCVGSVFDGTYWYLVPYGPTRVAVRYDVRRPFEDPGSWESFDAEAVSGLATVGYDGGAFDGRFVYFIPFWDGTDRLAGFHANVLRYDTSLPFGDADAWTAWDCSEIDGLHTVGYNAGAFDGRYLYWAPWHDGERYYRDRVIRGHGRVVRYDTTGDAAVFSLRWCDYGHNGGLCGAVPGPSFIVNTRGGPRSVRANRVLPAGRHHLAGVFDGRSVKLYVDGVLVGTGPADAECMSGGADVVLGRLAGGQGGFPGTILRASICRRARSAEWIAATWANLSDPQSFCRPAD